MIPEFLYRLSARDEKVTPLELVSFRNDTTSAAAKFYSAAGYTVPLGKVLLITSLNVEGYANGVGAEVLFVEAIFYRAGAGSADYRRIWSKSFGDTAATRPWRAAGDFMGSLFIPEGATVFAGVNCSSGVAGNECDFDMTGILIPRGNFAI